AHEGQRRHLPGADEEGHRRGLPDRGGAGAPLPPRLRAVAVLQRPAHRPHGHRRAEAVVRARRPRGAPAAACRGGVAMTDYREFYRGRRVMITGGLGFIGSNLARQLADLGADVLLVDSLIPEYGGSLVNIRGIEDRVRVNVADIRQQSTMNYLVG